MDICRLQACIVLLQKAIGETQMGQKLRNMQDGEDTRAHAIPRKQGTGGDNTYIHSYLYL